METSDYRVGEVRVDRVKKKEKMGFCSGGEMERGLWDNEGQKWFGAVWRTGAGKVTNYSAVPACLSSSASKSEICLLVTGDIKILGVLGGWPPL